MEMIFFFQEFFLKTRPFALSSAFLNIGEWSLCYSLSPPHLWIMHKEPLVTPPFIPKIAFRGLFFKKLPYFVFSLLPYKLQHVSISFWCSIRRFQNAFHREMDSKFEISLRIVKILKIFSKKRNVKKGNVFWKGMVFWFWVNISAKRWIS